RPDPARAGASPDAASDPLHGAFAPRIGVTDEEDADEDHGLNERVHAELAVGDSPGVQEHRLDVEHHEEQGEEVVADVVADQRVADRHHAALVYRQLYRVGIPGADAEDAKGDGSDDRDEREGHGEDEEEAGATELLDHAASPASVSRGIKRMTPRLCDRWLSAEL